VGAHRREQPVEHLSLLRWRVKPRLLDLFSGAGGCSVGYARAGFEVVGVDISPQPNFPFSFIQADALEALRYPSFSWGNFDAIHASPPCQAHVKGMAAVNRALGRDYDHADLVETTRDLLEQTGLPYVIENVVGAPLKDPIQLCGSSFGLAVRRHRLFETNFPVMALPCAHHLQREAKFWTSTRRKGEEKRATVVQVYGNGGETHLWADAMGIDWMTRPELAEAIPPAYTEHIGHYLLAHIQQEAKAA
jgi:DNA (cytosine-5)-methyltransferase 1